MHRKEEAKGIVQRRSWQIILTDRRGPTRQDHTWVLHEEPLALCQDHGHDQVCQSREKDLHAGRIYY